MTRDKTKIENVGTVDMRVGEVGDDKRQKFV